MNRIELKKLITDSFSDVPLPGPGGIGHKLCCRECSDLVSAFAELSWQLVPASLIDANYDKLPLFCPGAYHHFLPAYLLRSLDAIESLTREFTFYSITTREDNWFAERTRLFSAAQIDCIISYLEFEQTQFEENQDWLATDKVMSKRLKYWADLRAKSS